MKGTKMSLANLTNVSDSNTLEQLVEFEKRYNKTYVRLKFPHREEVEVWFIEHINGDEGTITLTHPKDGTIVIRYDTECEIIPDFPDTGLFNYGGAFLACYRRPDRQWKRGVCERNFKLLSPFDGVFSKFAPFLRTIDTAITFESLGAAYNSTYPRSLLAGHAILTNNPKLAGIAINKDIGLTKSVTEESGQVILWWHTNPIGTIEKGTRSITIHHQPMKQEILDFLTRTGERGLWNLQ